mgnify:CR=1 FL=1
MLGKGGMGTVFEAVHEAIERRVAIKILHPEYARTSEFAARFFNEARAVNKIDHPGLVQVNDYGQTPDGTAYIVMEYLRGETLGARLKRTNGVIPLTESLRMLRQVASALAAAHGKGIVHRDLKPDNIMLVPDPETPGGERSKLLDFGIAKVVEEARSGNTGAIGSPFWMAPEQTERGSAYPADRSTRSAWIADSRRAQKAGELRLTTGDRIFFDYNSSSLSGEAQATLERQANWLKQYGNVNAVVEGHCDERGTREYNLALGERRANAVKNYLVTLGVPAGRLSTISYGKERPAVLGSNESSWAQNRRGVTVLSR